MWKSIKKIQMYKHLPYKFLQNDSMGIKKIRNFLINKTKFKVSSVNNFLFLVNVLFIQTFLKNIPTTINHT